MSRILRITKNTAALFISQVICYSFYFMFTVSIARYLGPMHFGLLSFALAFTAIFGILIDFGLNPVIAREVARDISLSVRYLSNIVVMKTLLAIFTFGLIIIVIKIFHYPQRTVSVISIITCAVIFDAYNRIFYSIFQAHEKMGYQSLGQILRSTIMVVGALIAIRFGAEVYVFAGVILLGSCMTLLYNIIVLVFGFPSIYNGCFSQKRPVDWHFWRKIIREAVPFALGLFFVSVFYWVDSVMLSLMKGDTVVGWYNVSYRVVLVFLFIPQAYIAAIYPITSRMHKEGQQSLYVIYEKSFKLLTFLGVLIGMGLTFFGRDFILLVFGSSYVESILPLQILVWSSVLIFMSFSFANLFNSINKQIIVTKIALAAVITNIILNLLLIPKYSLIGASVTTVATELLVLILNFIYAWSIGFSLFRKWVTGLLLKVLFSSLAMGMVIVYFRGVHFIISASLAVMVYCIICYAVKGIDREDLKLLAMAVKGKTG